MFKLSNLRDIEDFVLGATILGTGGGGDPESGLKLLEEALRRKGYIEIKNVEEIEDGIIVVPYFVGTVAPGAKTRKEIIFKEPIKVAFEEMEKFLGKKIVAVAASEIGGGNTPVALYIGALLDLPTVDGDLLGRAAPELHQCTVNIFDMHMYPSVIVTSTGNIVIVKSYSDIDDYEAIARYMSVLDGKSAAVVDTPLPREDAKKVLVKNTLSLSLELGRRVREAREEGKDPIDAVVNVLKGWRIFEGVIEEYQWENREGFLWGTAIVKGIGKWEGHKLRSWIKNEHIMAWIDEKPIVMPPDLLIFLREDGTPITNTVLKKGDKIFAVAAKAPEIWRTPKGLELFGPRHFGFNYDYVPVEDLVKRVGV